MSPLIPTPEAQLYALVAAVLLGVSGSTVVARLHGRWGARLGAGFMGIYAAVLATALALGMAAGAGPGFGDPSSWIWALPVGSAIGFVSLQADLATSRYLLRRDLSRKPPPPMSEARFYRSMAPKASAVAERMKGRKSEARRAPASPAADASLTWLLVVGALEEAVFRGMLFDLARSLPHPALSAAGIVASAALFCFGHIHFGLRQVIAKVPLSILATGSAALLGAAPAVVAHAVFNGLAHRFLQARNQL